MPPRTSLSHCLSILSQVVPQDAATLVKDVPQEQILQALHATGSASIRHRKLPAEQMVWLVIGMSLFRQLSIVQIVDQLGLAVAKGPPVVPSAIHQARARLGSLPLLWLFEATAQKWAHDSAKKHAWHGLGVYGVDGTTMRVADSPENRDYFGGTKTPRGSSGYPLCRLVALMALRSHLLAATAFGPYETGELGYAEQLWDKLPDDSPPPAPRPPLARPAAPMPTVRPSTAATATASPANPRRFPFALADPSESSAWSRWLYFWAAAAAPRTCPPQPTRPALPCRLITTKSSTPAIPGLPTISRRLWRS